MSGISNIGLGNMTGALAARALAGGNAVEIIGRDPAKVKELAAALGGATAGDIVILAVPYRRGLRAGEGGGDRIHRIHRVQRGGRGTAGR